MLAVLTVKRARCVCIATEHTVCSYMCFHVCCHKVVSYLFNEAGFAGVLRQCLRFRHVESWNIRCCFSPCDCSNSQNFREMIPLLGIFRIGAITIFGRFLCVVSLCCVMCPASHTEKQMIFNLSFHAFFSQFSQILDLPSTEDLSKMMLGWG